MKILLRGLLAAALCAVGGCASHLERAKRVIDAQQASGAAPATPSVVTPTTSAPATVSPAPAAAAVPPASIAAPVPPLPSVQAYRGENFEHWIASVLNRGARLKLEDNSVWEIAPADMPQTMQWFVAQKITVVRRPDGRFPYKVTNTDKNYAADARLISQ